MTASIHQINQPLSLPCGLTFPNRLVKAAMAENSSTAGQPNDLINNEYSEWADGGWGALLTGNVMVDEDHFGSPNDISASDNSETLARWKQWADACQKHGTPAIVQLCHPGRQSPAGAGKRGFFAKTISSSAVPLNIGDGLLTRIIRPLVFGTPREMTLEDIEKVIGHFVKTTKLAYDAGFKGVELHAAHGYLLTQFLSPAINKRQDAFGGTAAKRAEIVVQIMRRIREAVPRSFCVGIKFNSTDYQDKNGLEEMREQIALIAQEGLDFLEVSGGTYEDPQMAANSGEGPQGPQKSERTAAREAFFLEAAHEIRAKFPDILLMVSGGFRTRFSMEAALHGGGCDMIGIGRPACIYPKLPKEIYLNPEVSHDDAVINLGPVPVPWVMSKLPLGKTIGAGAGTAYYGAQIRNMGKGLPTSPPAA